jgi:ubiquinone/menaquinone biosynthesis C-methylase UbiE
MLAEHNKEQYVLGHSARELDRLDLQGLIYEGITRRTLLAGGLQPGMRVLDIGCGSGDVARLAAEIVGETGAVLGLDLDEQAIASATIRANRWPELNVTFQVGEASAAANIGQFDALVGRFVLMHQPDPATVLAQAVRAVRPGGGVIFVESHMAALLNGRHSTPFSPLYDEIIQWKCAVVATVADIEAGYRLRQTFVAAGLPAPHMRAEAVVEGGRDSLIYRYMAETIRSMLPMAAAHQIDGFDEAKVDTLEARLRAEVVASGGVIVCWPAVGAWCQLPN